ncbi:energy-coupling factor transporter transmembrane protein EcfT [Antarcticimicrobium luteum]|uniref:Energy-coupling factor transporter transmembrane protein EcfT n=1 Tax=Antarcticimicrobium luteum TaxID=2547397 RepID=A0A4R5V9B8_9RHOB|nr:energy-coupling factor transporter transmembrane protein EcfT [Antarcticimicrobium luteum]TDK48728.1 energy-coupling factor transporter transmembrane protein EcfT [Antarcticimicrobium luteum]
MISLTCPVETWAHRRPAGLKLAALSLATALLFATDRPAILGAAVLGVAALYLSGGAGFFRAGLSNLRLLWPFLVLIALWHGLSGQIAAGLAVALRLVAALALANFVTMTTRLSDMIEVLSLLLAPFRRLGLSTRALELSIALVIRFTPSIADKGRLLGLSWRARSPRRPGWRIVMPMAALAIDDAEQVAEALRARGGLEPPGAR